MSLLTISLAVSEDKITYQAIENSPNKTILDKIDPELLVIYPAEQERYTITVFTDVFCPYCRKLHQNLNQFTDNGITVRFVPFPLTRDSNPVLESIWCAPKDQQQFLLDVGMLQMKFKAQSCDFPVIDEARKFSKELKVYGTPSIFLEDGRKVSGFMSPAEIIDGLEGRLNFDEWRPAHLRNQ
ncbi:hypothetical protein GCM10023338_14130 [Wohlfahrtiimonas larvae]|uniref:Thiol:disulfide interchange protein n=2 Tax=Wohlfahrtiimonas larvae TaxID=1157986 RepID=A0ABP9MSU5_9GAMM